MNADDPGSLPEDDLVERTARMICKAAPDHDAHLSKWPLGVDGLMDYCGACLDTAEILLDGGLLRRDAVQPSVAELAAVLEPWVVTHHNGCHEPKDEDWGSSLSVKSGKELAEAVIHLLPGHPYSEVRGEVLEWFADWIEAMDNTVVRDAANPFDLSRKLADSARYYAKASYPESSATPLRVAWRAMNRRLHQASKRNPPDSLEYAQECAQILRSFTDQVARENGWFW